MSNLVPSLELLNQFQSLFQGLQPMPYPHPRIFPEVEPEPEPEPEQEPEPAPPPKAIGPQPGERLLSMYSQWESGHQPGAPVNTGPMNYDSDDYIEDIDIDEEEFEIKQTHPSPVAQVAVKVATTSQTNRAHVDELGDIDNVDSEHTLEYNETETIANLNKYFNPDRHIVCLENFGDYIFQMARFTMNGDQSGYAAWYKTLDKSAKLMIQLNTFLTQIEKGAKVNRESFIKASGMEPAEFEQFFNKISYYRLILQRLSPPSFVASNNERSWEIYYRVLAELEKPMDNKQIKRNVMELVITIPDSVLRNRTAAQLRQMLDSFYQ